VVRRILVVEDERRLAELVKAFLSDKGYAVLVAFDGQKGVETALREKPAVVVSDVLLPKLDGWALCRRIKAEPTLAATKVILMTAVYTKARYRIDATEAGADDFVAKPLDLEDLAVRIGRLFHLDRPPIPTPKPAPPSERSEPEPMSRTRLPEVPAPRRQQPVLDVEEALAGLAPRPRVASGQTPPVPPASSAGSDFDSHLVVMRRRFAAGLPATLSKIERTWVAAAGGHEQGRWEELAQVAHDLSGSAGSFGLPAVGDAARELEEAVRTHLAAGGPIGSRARAAIKQHVERLGALIHLL